jgi:cell wall-associated NlpC family hydrolase
MFSAAAVIVFALTAKYTAYEVKADAAIKDQPSMVVRSASLNSDKVLKVPQKEVPKASSKGSTSKTSLSRGGSGISSAAGSSSVTAYANKYLGRKYIWGASGPNAFDCSGFTMYVFKQFGISLPHQSGSQYKYGKAVSKGSLASGDLVFFNTYGSISHVGIYIGGGKFIHASNSRTGVTISSLSEGYYASRYVGAKRILN